MTGGKKIRTNSKLLGRHAFLILKNAYPSRVTHHSHRGVRYTIVLPAHTYVEQTKGPKHPFKASHMLESNIKLKLFSLSFPLELAMLTLNSDRPVVQSKPGYLIYSASATSAPDIMMH